MSLSPRVAVVTGASSGIGLECARQLAAEGAAVVLGARRADRLANAVASIRAAGGRAEAVTMDVTSQSDVRRLVDRARETFGGLDIMICNAGFGYYGPVDETPLDVIRSLMDVNFLGTVHGARAALPIFRQQGRGHLIVVSSIVGRRGIPLMSVYTATKAAQVGFVESLRAEFAGTNIHASVVLPISTETEFRSAMQRDYGYSVGGLGPKQSAEKVGRAVLDCIRRPKAEVYPYRKSRGLTILNAIAPAFADGLVRRYGRRRVV